MSVIQLATRAEFMNRRTKAKSIPFFFTLQFLSLNFLSYRFHLSCLAFCVSVSFLLILHVVGGDTITHHTITDTQKHKILKARRILY